jgi:hypothetical protein
VVATDAFGDAYVIPAVDTLDNIRECMGAISVQLPSQEDFGCFNYNQVPLISSVSEGSVTSKSAQDSPEIPFLGQPRTKQWLSIFSTCRSLRDNQSYVESLKANHFAAGDDLELFLGVFDSSGPSYGNEVVIDFCRGLLPTSIASDAWPTSPRLSKSWLDDQSSHCQESRKYQNPMTAAQLLYSLKQAVR